MSTDNAIIRQSLKEPTAFGELFVRHAPHVHRYVARRVGESIADDVLSETFLIAFEKRSKFDLDVPNARPWLLGIATKLTHRHRVAEAKLLSAIERNASAERLDEDLIISADALDSSLEMRRLAGALRILKKGDRDALLLYAWEDLTYEEIGQALGIPTGTVRSRLNRARRILRDAPLEQEAPYGHVRLA